MTEPLEGQRAVVAPDWVAISVACATGVVLGLLPYLLYTKASYLALPLLAYAAIVVPWKGRGFLSHATERPDWLEWLLAGWNAVGVGAVASIVGFVWYGLVYFIIWAFGYAVRALGWSIESAPTLAATYVSAFFVVIFALATPFLLADELPPKLYPRIAGTRSVFFPLTAKPWTLAMIALLGIAGAIAGLALLDMHGLAFTLSLTLFLVTTGGPLIDLGKKERSSKRMVETLTALKNVLSAAGYALTDKPRTGSPEVDPLIACVDLLALSGNRGYAIKAEVHDSEQSDVEWSAAFDVRTAAKALQRVLRHGDAPGTVVEPYLLAIGGRVGDDLRVFSEKEGVKLVRLADDRPLRAALGSGALDRASLEAALRLLEVPFGEPATSGSGSGAGAKP
jgi:hypothetical protein